MTRTIFIATLLTLAATAAHAHETTLPHAHGTETLPVLAGLAVIALAGILLWRTRQ